MQKPSIGRIVHYYPQESDSPGRWNNGSVGEPVAAVITAVWSDECVNLRLLPDHCHDAPWVTSVSYDKERGEFSWSWPPRV